MFGIGMPEMLLILAVALIIIGPKKLPELAKTLGRALGDFKRATNDLKDSIEIDTGLDEVRDNLSGVKDDLNTSVSLADEAPTVEAPQVASEEKTEAPLAKVKEAFDALNNSDDTEKSSIPDEDAKNSGHPPKDKSTP